MKQPRGSETGVEWIRSNRFLGLVLLAVVALFVFHAVRYYGYLLDDTFISLRYARNWTDGSGLVFNPGERVEGYSNFLYVLLAALALRLGFDPLQATTWIMIAAALVLLLLLCATERLLSRLEGRVPCLPLAPLLLLPLPAFAYWSVVSLETMLFSTLLLAALLLSIHERLARRWRGAVLVFLLLSLTRPDGALCFAVCMVVLLILEWRERQGLKDRWKLYWTNAAIYVLGFGAYFAWRSVYYGAALPNTFYAKVTGGAAQWLSGLLYLEKVAAAFPLLLLALFAAPLLFRASNRRSSQATGPLLLIYATAVSYLLYTVWAGGDFMPFYRFFVPLLPLGCLLLAWMLRALGWIDARRNRKGVAVLAGVCLLNIVPATLTEEPYRAFVAHRTALVGRQVGAWLREHLPAGALIAVNTAGAVPYDSNLPAIDMLGLTDRNIAHRPVFIVTPGWAAHRRGWGEYVLDRRPAAILWYNSAGSREPHYLSDHELADDPFFRFFYEPRLALLTGATEPTRSRRPIGIFLGQPFGCEPSSAASANNLGVRAVCQNGPLRTTTLYETTIALDYFEFASRDEDLWNLRERFRGQPDEFVDAVAHQWRSHPANQLDFDPAAAQEVETLCRWAYQRIGAGDYAAARRLLSQAAARNDRVRSPLVYQYITNLGVLAGDLFTAVGAQKEALRLRPSHTLYTNNLKRLLSVPFNQLQPKIKAPAGRQAT